MMRSRITAIVLLLLLAGCSKRSEEIEAQRARLRELQEMKAKQALLKSDPKAADLYSIPIYRLMLKHCGLTPIDANSSPTNATIVRIWLSGGNNPNTTIHHFAGTNSVITEWRHFLVRFGASGPRRTINLDHRATNVWPRLESLGLLTLPSQGYVDRRRVDDGGGVGVRLIHKGKARLYSYYGPSHYPGTNNQAMAQILRLLDEEIRKTWSNKSVEDIATRRGKSSR